jgi:hypothetical protein
LTGGGRLDVTAALGALVLPLPPADRHEPNDDAGSRAFTLWGTERKVVATLDYWDDQNDVYRTYLRRGQQLLATLVGSPGTDPALALWKPGTKEIDDLSRQDFRVRLSAAAGPSKRLGYRARAAGWYALHVKLASPGSGQYRLSVAKR